MSLLPYIINELVGRYDSSIERLNNHYPGLGLLRNEDDYRRPSSGMVCPVLSGYLRPLRHVLPEESGISTVHNDKDQFKISLDVQQFKPEEIKVKVEDNNVIVEGKHEEREDKHGFISRQFTRRYKLPNDTDFEGIMSNLSSDGVLSITAPKKAVEAAKSREIPITHTTKPAIQSAKLVQLNDKAESTQNAKTEGMQTAKTESKDGKKTESKDGKDGKAEKMET